MTFLQPAEQSPDVERMFDADATAVGRRGLEPRT
jgi:hypothetical protein